MICNRGEKRDAEDRKKGVGSVMTASEGATESVEQEPDLVWISERRALDAYLGNIMACLRVSDNAGVDELSCSKSGGRFIWTSKNCPRKSLHTDFEVDANKPTDENPGYFVVVTGFKPGFIWAVPYSHNSIRYGRTQYKLLSKVIQAVKLNIPAFSVFIGRGVCTHAGPGYDDYDHPPQDGCIRYDMYFVPKDVSLVDGVHFMGDFQPSFKEDHRGSVKQPVVVHEPQNLDSDGNEPDFRPGETIHKGKQRSAAFLLIGDMGTLLVRATPTKILQMPFSALFKSFFLSY